MLLVADRPGDVERLREALDRAGVGYRTGLVAEPPPRVVFVVDEADLALAHAVVHEVLGRGGSVRFEEDASALLDTDESEDVAADEAPDVPPRFPWAELAPLATLAAGQLLVVLWSRGPFPFAGEVIDRGALAAGGTALEPWRLLTSLFVHLDPAHVLSNALGLFAFGVPLIGWCGLRAASGVYFAAGIGGGLAALTVAEAGTRIAGSSGAVAGLFGAWVVLALARGRADELPTRAWIRTFGIALLVLPSLLTPISASGRPVSVESHLGGLLTGMAVGALLASGLLARLRERPPMDPDEPDARFDARPT